MHDTEKYLQEYFSIDSVNDDVQKALSKLSPSAKKFREIKLTALSIKNGKETLLTNTIRYKNLGNGYIRIINKFYANGYQTSETYNLVLNGGLINLKSQTIVFNNDSVSKISSIKKISNIDPNILNPSPNSHYKLEFVHDAGIALYECNSGSEYSAKDIHPNIVGNATNVDCYLKIDGIDNSKVEFTYLREIGLLIYRGIKFPTDVSTSKITEFEIIN
jgi:hypothetical protein